MIKFLDYNCLSPSSKLLSVCIAIRVHKGLQKQGYVRPYGSDKVSCFYLWRVASWISEWLLAADQGHLRKASLPSLLWSLPPEKTQRRQNSQFYAVHSIKSIWKAQLQQGKAPYPTCCGTDIGIHKETIKHGGIFIDQLHISSFKELVGNNTQKSLLESNDEQSS